MSDQKLEYAKKLAAITGRPVSEFFNGTIQEEENKECLSIEVKNGLDVDANKNGSIETEPTSENTKKVGKSNEVTEELLAFQKLFAGSRIVNDKIMDGRQMTKKEYNKYTKGLDLESFYAHPLMYKMFRSEGQLDPSFMTFPNRFKNDKK